MCYVDVDDYCQVWKSYWPKAKKEHKCASCFMAIQPGDVYLKHFSVYDGYVQTDKACMVCATMWESFVQAHGAGYQPSMLDDMLHDCIADNSLRRYRSGSVSVAERLALLEGIRKLDGQWRSYMAIILNRRRKARAAKKATHGDQEVSASA